MSDKQGRLKVVLCWHMHQPDYYNPSTRQYRLPWTYLHAIKDYVDMAWYIEQTRGARAVVNFTPTLLEQLEDYATHIRGYHPGRRNRLFGRATGELNDPLLMALAATEFPVGENRIRLTSECLRANQHRLIDRYPAYARLAEMARWLLKNPEGFEYVHDQFFFDLVTWYHIAWLGESVKRDSRFIKKLVVQGGCFGVDQRLKLLRIIGEQIESIVPRYKRLAQKGKLELSVTPYAHPIAPLLLDINSAKEAWPDVELPAQTEYPGGRERMLWHIEKGLQVFERFFGYRPPGCWPAEGSICDRTLELFAEAGFQWAATGESVLKNSCQLEQNKHVAEPYSAHRRFDFRNKISCFFRDDGLSDEIGFNYSDWHADDAVANLVHHLKNIRDAVDNVDDTVVSIILDGENAWEYFPENGYFFLSALYRELVKCDELELTTFSQCIEQNTRAAPMDRVVAGSWVFGTFSTWIGHADKNLAWDYLIEAKKVTDRELEKGRFSDEKVAAIEKQLAICEGSDWFWWFGDYNPADSVKDFDELYRIQLRCLYELLELPAPDALNEPISTGGGEALAGGVMRPGNIDRLTHS